jgi:hypothetical protein
MPSFEHIVQTGRRAGGYIDYANQRNHILQPALVLAQERRLAKHITPHALCHTMITMLRDGGVAPASCNARSSSTPSNPLSPQRPDQRSSDETPQNSCLNLSAATRRSSATPPRGRVQVNGSVP